MQLGQNGTNQNALMIIFFVFDDFFLFWEAQTCNCVVRNQCYQNINSTTINGTDGSGVIDIRIVNPVSGLLNYENREI